MSRKYDAGKDNYKNQHGKDGQVTRHILANDTLEHYGANSVKYQQAQAETNGVNYRMGQHATNNRDKVIDNAWHREVFVPGGSYDPRAIASHATCPMSQQQQYDHLHSRFEVAKEMYNETGDHKYKMMGKDLRDIALDKLNGDGREWRM